MHWYCYWIGYNFPFMNKENISNWDGITDRDVLDKNSSVNNLL